MQRNHWLTLGAALVLGGCAFLSDFDAAQCDRDEDCTGPLAGRVCSAGSCVQKQAPIVGSDGGSSSGAEAGALPTTCSMNLECANAASDRLAFCEPKSKSCRSLKSGPCSVVLEQGPVLAGEDFVVVGGIGPVPVDAPLSYGATFNFTMALTEINAAGGVPTSNGVPRPLVMVLCDTKADLNVVANHLIDDLGVPGIVVDHSDTATFQKFLTERAVPAGTFVVNALFSNATLQSVNSSGRLWHMLAAPAQVALAYPAALDRVESAVRARCNAGSPDGGAGDAGAGCSGPLKVAVVDGPDSDLTELSTVAIPKLRFNGKADNSNAASDPNFKAVRLHVTNDTTTPPTLDWAIAAQSLIAFKPDIVISMATFGFVDAIMSSLRSGLPGKEIFYVLSPYNLGDNAEGWIKGGRNGQENAIVGINVAGIPVANKAVRDGYSIRLSQQFPNDFATRSLDRFENHYDSLYYLAYAMISARDTPLRGDDIAVGFQKITDVASGTEYPVGPEPDIKRVKGALSGGGSISLIGTLGPPEFDASRARQGVGSVYCYEADDTEGPGNFAPRYDVLRYQPTNGKLEGTLPCFPGF